MRNNNENPGLSCVTCSGIQCSGAFGERSTDHVLARHEPPVALLLVLEQKAERADLAVAGRNVQRGFAVAVADVHVDAARDLCQTNKTKQTKHGWKWKTTHDE